MENRAIINGLLGSCDDELENVQNERSEEI